MKYILSVARLDPWEFFKINSIKDVLKEWHPDATRRDTSAEFAEFQNLFEKSKTPPEKIGAYEILEEVEIGDLRRVVKTRCKNILKISRVKSKSADKLIKRELELIAELKKQTHYGRFVPDCESFKDSNIVVVNKTDKFISGAKIASKVKLPTQHIAWMTKRILDILGYIHHLGYGHCAITPEHIMFRPQDHAANLCGLIHHKKLGESIEVVPLSRKDWYTSKKSETRLDLSMLANTMVSMSDNLHPRIKRFFKGMSFSGNAWECHDEFDSLLREIYGDPVFHELVL